MLDPNEIETYKSQDKVFKTVTTITLLFTLIYFTAHLLVWVMR